MRRATAILTALAALAIAPAAHASASGAASAVRKYVGPRAQNVFCVPIDRHAYTCDYALRGSRGRYFATAYERDGRYRVWRNND